MSAATWLGVAAAWVAAGAAIVFGIISARQARAAHADAGRAERVVAAAQSQADETRRVADALQPPPKLPAWEIEHRGGVSYALRNVGSAVAHTVRIDAPETLARDLPGPEGVTLTINGSHPFVLFAVAQIPFPLDVRVSCDELEVWTVAIPPD